MKLIAVGINADVMDPHQRLDVQIVCDAAEGKPLPQSSLDRIIAGNFQR